MNETKATRASRMTALHDVLTSEMVRETITALEKVRDDKWPLSTTHAAVALKLLEFLTLQLEDHEDLHA
jgi:hypothetical protein